MHRGTDTSLASRNCHATKPSACSPRPSAGSTCRGPKVRSARELHGGTIINLFFESSTRTRASFEVAAKRLGADVVQISPQTSSVTKGEIAARHGAEPRLAAVPTRSSYATRPRAPPTSSPGMRVKTSIVNAGDGSHEHPTQALLDALTIRRRRKGLGFEGLVVAICGDILHSRVARSNALLLGALGAEVRLSGPRTLMPRSVESLGPTVRGVGRIEDAVAGADVVMMLRIQTERLANAMLASTREYARTFGLTECVRRLAKADAIVMHPGPINRGVELDPGIADGERGAILRQVEAGVAVRMAVLECVARGGRGARGGTSRRMNRDAPLGVFDSGLGGLTVVRALRGASRRTDRVPGRHGACSVRHQGGGDRRQVCACVRASPRRPRRQGDRDRVQHGERGRSGAINGSTWTCRSWASWSRAPGPRWRRPGRDGSVCSPRRARSRRAPTRVRSRSSRRAPRWWGSPRRCWFRSPRRDGRRGTCPGWWSGATCSRSRRHGWTSSCSAARITRCCARSSRTRCAPPWARTMAVVDSARATAEDTHAFLEARGLMRPGSGGSVELLVTDVPRAFQEVAARFLGDAAPEVEQVDL